MSKIVAINVDGYGIRVDTLRDLHRSNLLSYFSSVARLIDSGTLKAWSH